MNMAETEVRSLSRLRERVRERALSAEGLP